MTNVLIDTNFFVLSVKYKKNLLNELNNLIPGKLNFFITIKIFNELKSLKTIESEIAFKFLEGNIRSNKIQLIENQQHPDEFILIFARREDSVICTNDAELRKKIKKTRGKVVSFKANKELDFV